MNPTSNRFDGEILSDQRQLEAVGRSGPETPALGAEELRQLNEALDQLLAAVDRLARDVRATLDCFQPRPSES